MTKRNFYGFLTKDHFGQTSRWQSGEPHQFSIVSFPSASERNRAIDIAWDEGHNLLPVNVGNMDSGDKKRAIHIPSAECLKYALKLGGWQLICNDPYSQSVEDFLNGLDDGMADDVFKIVVHNRISE